MTEYSPNETVVTLFHPDSPAGRYQISKVAKAIYAVDTHVAKPSAWAEEPSKLQDAYRIMARAALDALTK